MQMALGHERKAARKEFEEEEGLKNIRWALLKSNEDLDRREKEILEVALSKSENLAAIYQMRMDLKALFFADYTPEKGCLPLIYARKKPKSWFPK